MKKNILSLFLICLLTACSSLNYIGIETYNPAEVTFPDNVRKVMIVNNALPQPPDVGCEYILSGVRQDTCSIQTDSALFDACRGLGEAIMDMNYFEDVLLYHYPTRNGDDYFADPKLTQAKVQELCDENDVDAIISIDRLLFNTKKNITAFEGGYYYIGIISVEASAVMRSYLPERANPLATVLMHDSIYWGDSADNLKLMNAILPTSEKAVREAAKIIGAKAHPNFVPHWQEQTRWYYNGMSSSWKEASAYANTQKWEQAAKYWQSLYDKSSGWKSRAKAASNLALASEISGDLKKAHEWATISFDLFNKNSGEADKNTILQKAYLQVLTERIRSDQKLNVQFGTE